MCLIPTKKSTEKKGQASCGRTINEYYIYKRENRHIEEKVENTNHYVAESILPVCNVALYIQ